MQADPESMPENDLAHEFSGSVAHAGVDSGSASEFEPVVFAGSEAGSNAPSRWRPPGMTGWGLETWFGHCFFSVSDATFI